MYDALHCRNIFVLRIDLRFQLLDFVVQHELKLLQLRILLLQLVDLRLLVA